MVSTLETEKELKSKSEQKGSEQEPIPWQSPGGNKYEVYKENGTWFLKMEGSDKFNKLDKGSYFTSQLEESFKDVDTSESSKSEEEKKAFENEEEEFELAEKPKTEQETQKSLSDPETQKQIIADYKFGKSTGAIAKSLGFEQNKANRNKIRNILKKAGVYKQKELAPVDSGPSAKDVLHKEIEPLKSDALAEKIGEQKGTNPGGLYKGADGVKRYVKFYADPVQASCEMLSNAIYNDLGIGAPKSGLINNNGKIAFASEYMEDAITLKDLLKSDFGNKIPENVGKKIMKGFAADVLLKNWDAVGTGFDNVVFDAGKAYRIDNGGSLLFRAKAGKKTDAQLSDMSELEQFFNSAKNPYYAKVAQAAGYRDLESMGPELAKQVADIENMVQQNGGWSSYIDKVKPQFDVTTKAKIADMLKTRTEALKAKSQALSKEKSKTAGQVKAEQVTLSNPTTYEPGKLAKLAEKYIQQGIGKTGEYDTTSSESLMNKYYAEAGISASSGHATDTAIKGWTGSSHSKGGVLMKIVAATFYGKDPTAEPKMDKSVKSYFGGYQTAIAQAKNMQEAFLAQKELTAAWVAKYGAKHVYRGIHGELATKIKQQIAAGAKEIEFNANSLSSWSESKAKASQFASGQVLMKMKVDPNHVWTTYKTAPHSFGSFLSEKEYVMGAPGEKFKISVSDIEVS